MTQKVEGPLQPIFEPRSIAVIGASRTPGTVGYELVHNLLADGYTGAIYPVNPNAQAVHSIPAYASVSEIPYPIDLGIIAVPKHLVVGAAEECGRKGVRSLVVVSAGFKEIGRAGRERELELLAVAQRYHMRMIGPNCLGVLNTAPEFSMNATFAPIMPPPGPVSFISQSGAMGITILDYAAEYGIGVHHFVSVGNKADVSGNDLIEYWSTDPETGLILMYLENFGNPQKFTRLAREVTRQKPIVVVKTGRTAAGARAASSHTGALAGQDSTTEALLAQCGVIRVDTVEQLFDLAMAFSHLPVPEGNRVAVVTNSGGPGIIIADACESHGLRLTELTEETQVQLRTALPEEASVANPVDMIGSATPATYRTVLDIVLQDANVDAVIAAFVPPLRVRQEEVASAIVAARKANPGKPMIAVLMGREGLPQGRAELNEANVPAYIFPESAARALAAMYRYRRWQERPAGTVCSFDVDRAAADEIIARQHAAGGGYLPGADVLRLLSAYGINTLQSRFAPDRATACQAALELGLPVVMKIVSPQVVHKTDVGGVALDLRSIEEIERAWDTMMERVKERVPDARIEGVLIEQYVRGGRETIIGMSQDPSFGPVLMFGLGGIYVEALQDVTFRIHPVTDNDAHDMVRAIRGIKLLEGVRGEPPADLAGIEEAIQRVSQLVGDQPLIAELDINPLVVFEKGTIAVDARVRVCAPPAAREAGA